MIKVLFVDDEPRMRQVWEKFLQRQPDIRCVGMMGRANEVADAVSTTDPEIVIMDLSMPGEDPLNVVRELVATGQTAKVIIYSGYTDPDSIRESFEAGAWGFVDKLTPPNEILNVVRRVAHGEVVFP